MPGETVYLSIGTPSHFFFRYMMVQDGLDDTDIVIEHMDADQVGAAFVAGKIDYGMSWEPWLSRATERERGKLLLSTRDLPGIVTDTYVVRADTLEEREDEVEAILRAWFDSIDFIKTDRQEAYAIMADQMGLPVEEFGAMAETVRFLDYEASLARFDRSTMFDLYELTDEATRIYMADGLIMSEVSAEEIVEPSVLEGLYD
ncbi:ABC transporter substrate-binding protein [Candidatus Woesearchaeota archaeon]|nr:ABC transporter substrate-binding protein [Candidatus Woesearchaeota archaeon]